jgi:hypothetical protein
LPSSGVGKALAGPARFWLGPWLVSVKLLDVDGEGFTLWFREDDDAREFSEPNPLAIEASDWASGARLGSYFQ